MKRGWGTLYGVGVGPGDPELLTLRAAALIRRVDKVCYPVNERGESLARRIAAACLEQSQEAREIPIPLPMSADSSARTRAYAAAAARLEEFLSAGAEVAFLCEGDSLFYGSFVHLWEQLGAEVPVEVIPGVSALHAAAAAARFPLVCRQERLAVLPSSQSDAALLAALKVYEGVVIYKAGRRRRRLLELLRRSGREDEAVYVERAGQPGEELYAAMEEVPREDGDYFGTLLVSRRGKRVPGARPRGKG